MVMTKWCATMMLAAISFGLLAGCGGSDSHRVSGTVRVKGGDVLKQGNVQFISDAATATGMIKEDGSYTLSSSGVGDGAPAGTYKVVFLSTEIGGGYDNPGEESKQVIDSKYTNPTTTPIEVQVPGGDYDFELDPPGTG